MKGGQDMSKTIENEKKEMIRKLSSHDPNCLELSVSLELDKSRYEWREINWSRFLYDKKEKLYIPEQVYIDILSKKLHLGSDQ